MDDEKNKDETFLQKHGAKIFFALILFFAVVLIYQAIDFYRDQFGADIAERRETWGQFGDYFGGLLNPILSFLALIALLFTIILQSKELKLATREMHDSSTALKEQSDSLKLQNFENTFFNLLNNHKNSANNYSIKSQKNNTENGYLMESITTGKKCFTEIFGYFNSKLKLEIDPVKQIVDKIEHLLSLFDFEYYLQEQNDLIDLILIGENQIPTFNFDFYSNIIKRQYSDAELVYFYCFHMKNNNKRHIDFLQRAHFFEKINFEWLFPIHQEVILFFGEDVYGENIEKYKSLLSNKETHE